MATQLQVLFGTTQYHRQRIPADDGTNTPLHALVTGHFRFLAHRNGVDVRSSGFERQVSAITTSLISQGFQQVMGTFSTFFFHDSLERVQPFTGFLRVHVMHNLL